MSSEAHVKNRKRNLYPSTLRARPLAASIQRIIAAGFSLGAGPVAAHDLPVPTHTGSWVSSGAADLATKGHTMIINQHSNRATLNWDSFNISSDGSVRFSQPSANSIALNRINQGDPSQIMGNLTANGQVYLLNPNGFLFGKNSRVDVNTLVASSLNISDDTFNRGITKVLSEDGRAALTGSGAVYRTDAQGNFILDKNGQKVKIGIEFQQGSSVITDKSGRIIAAAPSIINEGNLSSPDGQILMVAATDKVYLQETNGNPLLRGLVVEVATGGSVNNLGSIVADRGNVTLMGFAVNQNGLVSARTSVQANGSVRLLAREGAQARIGGDGWTVLPGSTKRATNLGDGLGTKATVTLGQGSLTQATPNLKDKTTAVDGQTQLASHVEIMGKNISIQKGATLRSRSGVVSVTATENPGVWLKESPENWDPATAANVADPTTVSGNDSQVTVAPGAIIDVSGIRNVQLPMSRNVAEVQLLSNELRDAPVQKSGPLYSKKVLVDIRKGTPIADISGALDRIARTVAERSMTGGKLSIASEGTATLASGSALDFSGGFARYLPGYITTSLLVGPDGKTAVDIGKANPNVKYTGLKKISSYQAGYVDGRSAGSLNIQAATLALAAQMKATAVNGALQQATGSQAAGGSLVIDLSRTVAGNESVEFGKFGKNNNNNLQADTLQLNSASVSKSGVQNLSVLSNNTITVDAGQRLKVGDGGALSLTAGEVDVNGQIEARSGKVTLYTPGPSDKNNPNSNQSLSGAINIGSQASINTSGIWKNDRPGTSGSGNYDAQPVRINGGSVSIKAALGKGAVNVADGSTIDVSGAGQRTTNRKITAGDAGNISIVAAALGGSDLTLKGNLLGYALSGGKGGTLSLTSDQVLIGYQSPDHTPGTPVPLFLDNAFFTNGGFASYNIASNKDGVTVSDYANVQVSVKTRELDPTAAGRPTGTDVATFSNVVLQPEVFRPAGSLTLGLAQTAGSGGKDAAVHIGEGATVTTDAGGSISLKSDGSIIVNGLLSARAGKVNMNVTTPAGDTDPAFLPNQGIWLGYNGAIDVSGTSLTYDDGKGVTSGRVLDGGSVSLQTDRGFIVAAQGSAINVAGTSAVLDLPTQGGNGKAAIEPQVIASNAGKIAIKAADGMQLYGYLQANGGGAGAQGGTLSLELNPLSRNPPEQITNGLPFPATASVFSLFQSYTDSQQAPVQGSNVGASQYGLGIFSADQSRVAQFANISLKTADSIVFNGDLSMAAQRNITLDAPVLAFKPLAADETGTVSITAPTVALGSTQTLPGNATPSSGNGTLAVQTGLLDLTGTTALQGFKAASLNSSGDIRMIGVSTSQTQRDYRGEFLLAGDLNMAASQIYPATLTNFRVAIENDPGATMTISQNAAVESVPLSAGGRLVLEAPNIEQGGTVRAPMGELDLTATNRLDLLAGSTTSVSANGTMIPFGRNQGGIDWVFPKDPLNLVYGAPPSKILNLSGDNVNIANGSLVDASGGGDLFSYQFVSGPGGTYDVLDPSSAGYKGSYAILPNYSSPAAPYDPIDSPKSGLGVGDSIYLSGGGGLKAGTYLLLPADYALLPGAYLVTPQSGTTDLQPGIVQQNGNGAAIVAGYRTVADTPIRDARWSGFAVEKGDAVLKRAEYTKYTANDYFTQKAADQGLTVPVLPQDGGSMTIAAQSGLNLDGQLSAAPAGKGKGGSLDIAANNIAIVAAAHQDQQTAGMVQLIAEKLNDLTVSSISIGGIRSAGSNSVNLAVAADSVSLGQDAKLNGEDFILAAKNSISFAPGSGITATGTTKDAQTAGPEYDVSGDSAFVRVSSGGQARLVRSQTKGATGSIILGSNASLSATGSIIDDATANNQLAGKVETQNGSVALGAQRISLGYADSTASGLILDQSQLDALKANVLSLNSGSDISLYGAANINASQLTMHSSGLLGFANAGQVATLTADKVLLDNSQGVVSGLTGSGSGALQVNAKTITLGQTSGTSNFTLAGFGGMNLAATQSITSDGAGSYVVGGNLGLDTPILTGNRGADTSINAKGYSVSIANPTGGAAIPVVASLGARLAVSADSIQEASAIVLPSGSVSLNAVKGNLEVTGQGSINVAGASVTLGKTVVKSDGGSVALSAGQGDVKLDSGSSLSLGGLKAGSLTLTAPGGNVDLSGTINAQGSQTGGRFVLNVGSSGSVGDLGVFASKLATSGFTDELSLTTQSGGWLLGAGESMSARQVSLAASQGDIEIDGSVTAQGGGASISLETPGHLTLADTASLIARGTAAEPGQVSLSSVNGLGDGNSGIRLANGATIDVHDQNGNADGVVRLRADRVGQDVAVDGSPQQVIQGAAKTTLEAVRIYDRAGSIGDADIQKIKADTDSYMANASAVESRLGLPGDLLAGIEIKSTGDLTLAAASGWDFASWRYDGRPGVLTLDTTGNLLINGKLSDGFQTVDNGLDISALAGPGAYVKVYDMLQSGNSWSYRLNAGGDVTVGQNSLIRTGTGDIAINSGRDLVLADSTAAIYTAGHPEDANRYGSFNNVYVGYNFFGEYPTQGGSIQLNAGRDVVGAKTGQFFDGWYAQTGNWSSNQDHTGETPTAWAVVLGVPDIGNPKVKQTDFRQNIGALGGGNVTVAAGRDVIDLTTVIPTTGKQTGNPVDPSNPENTDFTTNAVNIAGGGNLSVSAGNNVIGGTFYTGRGNASIAAGGSIESEASSQGSSTAGLGAVIALGDSNFSLKAGNNIELGAALNPSVISNPVNKNYFFTYTDSSSVALQSVSGDVSVQSNIGKLIDSVNALRTTKLNFPGVSQSALSVYPASLNVAALQGNVEFGQSLITYPSAAASFSVLAGGNITTGTTGNAVNITQSDADPALLPSVMNPAKSWTDADSRLQPFGNSSLLHAKVPVHAGQGQQALISANGSITSNDPLLFSVATALDAQAGKDILDVSFHIEQPDYALSSIASGRDIRFTLPRDASGNVVSRTQEIREEGPGQLWVTAGRNVDLGASEGIYTIGNTSNSALPSGGSSISIIAGLADAGAHFSDFASKYNPLGEKYASELTSYMQGRLNDSSLNHASAVAAYQALPEEQRREFLVGILFQEIRNAATIAAKSGNKADYQPGYDAIDAMFPGAGKAGSRYSGDLKLFYSKVHTVDGGDINLMVPGGKINAGLAVSLNSNSSSSAKKPDDLGIVAQGAGGINAMVNGNFEVNQSRVFAMNGGDITIWSSRGNIDAGRGAKAALAVPPPIISFDPQGNLVVTLPPAVSGSGIRTAASTVAKPGDVFLAAPAGVVNAGEAGIGGNNITIAATGILGASTGGISAGGSTSTNVTMAAPIAVPSAGASAAASAATNTATQTAEDAVNNDTNQAEEKNQLPERLSVDDTRMNPLQIDILGFGECGVADVREGKPGCV